MLRIVCCAAVLLYHLGLLGGGFFAVCTFFVLSGYLGVKSAFRQEKFNIFRHYLKRLLHIYLPLLAVVLITVGVVCLLPQIKWLNLKPETTSVLLGCNNFWQIGAARDYFARHTDSPFIHFWYIAILLQFELVFPIVFVILKFVGKKISRVLACLLPLAVCGASFVYLYRLLAQGQIVEAYYHSMARAFAPFLGVALGFAEQYAGLLVPEKLRTGRASAWIFSIYLIIFAAINVVLDSGFKYLSWAFLAVTLISARLISYACATESRHEKAPRYGALAFIADSSYEIYLVQYPLIFLGAELFSKSIDRTVLTAGTIGATLLIAFLMHFGLHFKKGRKPGFLKIATLVLLLAATAGGGYYYSVAEDHTQELAELERRMEENAREMEERQKQIEEQNRSEEGRWEELLASFDGGEERVLQAVKEMPVVFIGDSVMLGAVKDLAEVFPNSWIDAKKSRSSWQLPAMIQEIKDKGLLGEVVVICLGANGDGPEEVKERALEMLDGCLVFWLTNTNPKMAYCNDALVKLAEKHSELNVLDWLSISSTHPEYFYADGIHLTIDGREAFANVIFDAVSHPYLEEWRQKKAEAEAEYEKYRNQMVSFYGNDLLTNVYPLIAADYPHGSFRTYETFDIETFKKDLKVAEGSLTLADRVVLALDNTVSLSRSDIQQISEACAGRKLYLVTPGTITEIAPDGSTAAERNWGPKGAKMFMADDVHLTPEANEALREALQSLELAAGR